MAFQNGNRPHRGCVHTAGMCIWWYISCLGLLGQSLRIENEEMSSHPDMKKGHSFKERAYSYKTWDCTHLRNQAEHEGQMFTCYEYKFKTLKELCSFALTVVWLFFWQDFYILAKHSQQQLEETRGTDLSTARANPYIWQLFVCCFLCCLTGKVSGWEGTSRECLQRTK